MKRKFSLSSIRLVSAFDSASVASIDATPLDKTASPFPFGDGPIILNVRQNLVLIHYNQKTVVSEESSPAEAFAIDSPPYSPSPSETERRELPSDIISQLRQSCAVIVQETSPQGLDDLPNHIDTLRRLNEEHEKQKRAAAARSSHIQVKPEIQLVSSGRPRLEIVPDSHKPSPRYTPQNAAANVELIFGGRKQVSAPKFHEISPELPESVKQEKKPSTHHAFVEQITKIRAAERAARSSNLDRTTAASSGPSANSSAATSRSTTTYGGIAQTISTGLSSLATTPADPHRSSIRHSDQSLPNGSPKDLHNASAKARTSQEISGRRAGYAEVIKAKAASRFSLKQKGPERPSSRAGAIAGSIADGVKDYIRPRRSNDILRPKVPVTALPRRGSCDTLDSRKNDYSWWCTSNLMRNDRDGTSAVPPLQHVEGATGSSEQDGSLDLNRALPPLPSLSEYREKKAGPKHIAQLMRPGVDNRKTLESKYSIRVEDGTSSHVIRLSEQEPSRSQPGQSSAPDVLPLPTRREQSSDRSRPHKRLSHKTSQSVSNTAILSVFQPKPPNRLPEPARGTSSTVRFTPVQLRTVPDPSAHSAPAPAVRFSPIPSSQANRPNGATQSPYFLPQDPLYSTNPMQQLQLPLEKAGLRKRLSRFLNRGSNEKGLAEMNKGMRNVIVVAN